MRNLFPALLLVFLFVFRSSAIADTAQIAESYGKIPLAFTLNQGQTDSRVKFTTSGNGCSMFFSPTGTTFLLKRETAQSVAKRAAKKAAGTPENMIPARDTEREYESFAAKTVFVDANSNPDVVGEDRLPWNNNYFIGSDPAQWQTDVPNYGKIRLKDVYSGIDLVYYGNKDGIKYDFVVKPGENPSKIVLRYDLGADGGNALSINGNGELAVKTPLGEIIEKTLYCYQKINGKEMEVPIHYRILDAAANSYGFDIGAFDSKYDLYIDPELVYSTFIGGSDLDFGFWIAVDNSGNVYLTGSTSSSNYPMTSGAYDISQNGSADLFVSKLNENGTTLLYSTFLGGGSSDSGNGIAVDSTGNAYVTGTTISSDYPVTSGAYTTGQIGDYDVCITKLNANGNGLVYSTFFGGDSSDSGNGIAVDSAGNAYVTGITASSDYPVTSGAYTTFQNGGYDVCITKLNASGDDLFYSTYFGGAGNDLGNGIAVDSAGNAYISGTTYSSDFPVTDGAYDTIQNGSGDAFVMKLNAGGAALLYSTFLGGSSDDSGFGIAIDNSGNAYVTGDTYSSEYPVTNGAYDSSQNGMNDVFVTKLNAGGAALLYSTFTGGHSSDWGNGIAVDSAGNAYVTGYTESSDYPVTNGAYDSSQNGDFDVFVTKLNTGGATLLYSTFLGGHNDDRGCGIAVDSAGNAYVTGETKSTDYPVTSGAYNSSQNGVFDVFVTKLIMSVATAVDEMNSLPDAFRLGEARPNPFNPSTTIEYSLPRNTRALLRVYNVSGQKVATLADGVISAGQHSVVWDAKGMPSGVYFYSLSADGGYAETKKALLLK